MSHVLQNHPEIQLCRSKLQPWRQAVVAMGMTIAEGNVARSHPSRAVLVTVGCEKPAVLQDISGVQGSTSLATHQFDSCTLWTGVVQVGG